MCPWSHLPHPEAATISTETYLEEGGAEKSAQGTPYNTSRRKEDTHTDQVLTETTAQNTPQKGALHECQVDNLPKEKGRRDH